MRCSCQGLRTGSGTQQSSAPAHCHCCSSAHQSSWSARADPTSKFVFCRSPMARDTARRHSAAGSGMSGHWAFKGGGSLEHQDVFLQRRNTNYSWIWDPFRNGCPLTYRYHPFSGRFPKKPVGCLHPESLLHLLGMNYVLTCFTCFYFISSSQHPRKWILLLLPFYS